MGFIENIDLKNSLAKIIIVQQEDKLCISHAFQDRIKEAQILFEELDQDLITQEFTDQSYQEHLYICQNAFIAHLLMDKGYFVIILLTEKNRDQDFSGFLYAIEKIDEIETDFLKRVWQRYRGIPWYISETDRCVIREMAPEDLDAIYALYADPSVTQYMENLYEDRDQELNYIHDYIKYVYSYYGFGTWLIVEKTTGIVIGRAGFNYRSEFDEPELGFLIAVPYQHKGYAREVCEHILSLGKEVYEFEKVQALIDPKNIASRHLLLKLKFQSVGNVMVENKSYERFIRAL